VAAHDGAVCVDQTAGLMDREAERPIPQDAVFRLASLTKAVTTAVTLALEARGDLSLDAAVTDFLPAFRPALPGGQVPVITLRHLLTHTSGLSYGFSFPADANPYAAAGVSDGLDAPGLGLAENLARLATCPLLFAPGSAWRYSLATDVLGGVVEKAGGAPLDHLVADLLGRPLGWRHTGFAVAGDCALVPAYADGRIRMSARHVMRTPIGGGRFSEVVFAPGRVLDPASYPSGGAGMVGTARDYLAFLESVRTGQGGCVTPQQAAYFATNATGTLSAEPGREGRGFGFGTSVLLDPAVARSPLSAGSFSWGGAYGHSWFVDPARRLSVVALTNTTFAGMVGPLPDAIRDAFFRI